MKRNLNSITILDLVRTIQDNARSDEEVVAVMTHMFHTRRVRFVTPSASKRTELLPSAA